MLACPSQKLCKHAANNITGPHRVTVCVYGYRVGSGEVPRGISTDHPWSGQVGPYVRCEVR
jgi:hypothetical protein